METERLDGTDSRAALPLAEEALRVGERRVETGRVRVPVSAEAGKRLARETPRDEVERVAAGRGLAEREEAPATWREEDGTVVVPVLGEVLVVERRPVLREEVRPRLVAAEEAVEQPQTPRSQRAEVERLPASAGDHPDGCGPRHTVGSAA